MNPNQKELDQVKAQVKEALLTEVKRRAVERILNDNKDRLERYYATLSHELAETISKEFPL